MAGYQLINIFLVASKKKIRKSLSTKEARLVVLQLSSPEDVVQLHLDNMMSIAFIRKMVEPDPPPCAHKACCYGVRPFEDAHNSPSQVADLFPQQT